MHEDEYPENVTIDEKLYNYWEGTSLAAFEGKNDKSLFYANRFVDTLESTRASGEILNNETRQLLPHWQEEVNQVLTAAREAPAPQVALGALDERGREQGGRGI